jgi:hypothetical protein
MIWLTPEPTATPTLTVEELRDLRATAVLTTLPGYDPAHHDDLLPLARHLWGESDLVDPAEVTIVAGETAVQVTSDAAYPSGTLFVWNADSHPQPLILTGQQNTTISRGEVAFGAASLNTWVRYDLDGNVLEFVDPAGNWISPLDIQTDGSFSFFTQERILADGSRENTNTVWWANGGQPVSPPLLLTESGLETVSTSLVPFYFGPSNSTVRYGLHFNELTNSLNIIIQMPPGSSTDAGVGSQPHVALWESGLGTSNIGSWDMTKLGN